MSEAVLLTGATGFLGMELLVRLLERTDHDVLAVIRAEDSHHAQQRADQVMRQLYDEPPGQLRDRLRAVPGDLARPDLGLDDADLELVMGSTKTIIHCAASVAFDSPLAHALTNNTVGTAQVLTLAEQLHRESRLRRLLHVSTAYVCGRRGGQFAEGELHLDADFRNHYERSKAYAEHILRASDPGLPLIIARPSIVVGDSKTGWTPTFNVIYWPLRAFERGLLDTIPGDPGGTLDIVPVDYVADGLLALLDTSQHRATFHLVAGDNAVTNLHLSRLAAHHMELADVAFDASAAVPRVEELSSFAPYFDIDTTFADGAAKHDLAPSAIRAPSIDEYFPALLAYARHSRWGKRSSTRQAAGAATTTPVH
jgi:long-chain acyl-CoA synthetase